MKALLADFIWIIVTLGYYITNQRGPAELGILAAFTVAVMIGNFVELYRSLKTLGQLRGRIASADSAGGPLALPQDHYDHLVQEVFEVRWDCNFAAVLIVAQGWVLWSIFTQ